MFYLIDANHYFVEDAPDAEYVTQFIVAMPPLNVDGTGMRKPRWSGTWDSPNKQWINGSWVDDEASQLGADIAEKTMKVIELKIDSYIKSVAQSKGYNNTESCLSYIGDTNIRWAAEASAFRVWRTQCWEYVIQEQQKIKDGLRTTPTPEEAVLELPPMVWPV